MPEAILGLDFLQEYNCTINLSIPVLQIPERGLEVPLQGTHKVHHSSDVEMVNVVNIPARSELEVVAKTRVDVEDGGTRLMEEKSNCKHPALVAWAVVSPHKGTVVLHLLNPHSGPITLHGKATIAELTELDSVSIVIPSAGVERAGTMSEEKREMLLDMVKKGHSGFTPPQSSLRTHNFTWKSNNRRAN